MRIIAGKFKGLTLHISKDINTRPLKDLVRESIFNLITHSNKIISKIENSQILDLYSGTGSFGLGCISRNAKSVFFIENKIMHFFLLILGCVIRNFCSSFAGNERCWWHLY